MKVLQTLLGIAVLISAVLVALLPIGPVPGFFIGGTLTEKPAEWMDTSSVHEVRLKVPGTLPRVVVIWFIAHQGEFHVAGSNSSGWVKMLGDGAPVKLRLDDNTYSLKATRVTEDTLPILDAYADKYRPDYPDIVASFGEPEAMMAGYSVFRLNGV